MSTKTSIKRVALVAAAALTIGGFSAVSAHATAATATLSVTSGQVSGGTAAIAATATGIGDGNHYLTVVLAASTADGAYTVTSSGVGSIYGSTFNASAVTTVLNTNGTNAAGGFVFETGTSMTTLPTASDRFPASKSVSFNVVAAAAGTQVITATPINGTSAASTLTITWGAAPTLSVANSSAVLIDSTTAGPVTQAQFTALGTTDATAAQPKATLANLAAVYVQLKDNEVPAVVDSGVVVSASISGPGLVVGQASTGGALGSTYAQSASSTTDGNGIAVFGIAGSNASGTGTITISTTNSTTGVVTVIATKTITFYSTTVASLSVVVNSNVPLSNKGGFVPAYQDDNYNAATPTEAKVYVVGKDSNGNAVPAIVVSKVSSSNPQVATATIGNYNANAGGTKVGGTDIIIAPVSLGTTTITVTDSTGLVTATGVVTVASSSIASVASSTDAAAYDIATKVKWLVTAKDSAGNPVADGAYVGFWTTAPTTTVGLQGWTGNGDTTTLNTVAGVSEVDVYAPVTPGSNVSITGGVISKDGAIATALQGTTVADATFATNGGADSSAATDAANAATDAANAAADAADNATQAASEALAAVNSLATTVASLIAGIKAQITSLTNLITKIKNKVGA